MPQIEFPTPISFANESATQEDRKMEKYSVEQVEALRRAAAALLDAIESSDEEEEIARQVLAKMLDTFDS